MEYSLRILCTIPTLNEYINVERANRYSAAALKKKVGKKVAMEAMGFKLPKNTKFDLLLTWYKKDNRKDHDNISFGIKFILDGIVSTGALKGDSPRFIGNISHKFELSANKTDYCVITFIEI
ncbi:MAG: Holliday junction resolvase [Desulfotalea sp.]|nr:MAG: Holliday junction resolvase [Desulfotalea sp.]